MSCERRCPYCDGGVVLDESDGGIMRCLDPWCGAASEPLGSELVEEIRREGEYTMRAVIDKTMEG